MSGEEKFDFSLRVCALLWLFFGCGSAALGYLRLKIAKDEALRMGRAGRPRSQEKFVSFRDEFKRPAHTASACNEPYFFAIRKLCA